MCPCGLVLTTNNYVIMKVFGPRPKFITTGKFCELTYFLF